MRDRSRVYHDKKTPTGKEQRYRLVRIEQQCKRLAHHPAQRYNETKRQAKVLDRVREERILGLRTV